MIRALGGAAQVDRRAVDAKSIFTTDLTAGRGLGIPIIVGIQPNDDPLFPFLEHGVHGGGTENTEKASVHSD